ncbi:hypothetical protein QH494_11900 [Sphingomonas sp. AR_OL41]|uniref:hypothetical protein n=1 Tax=Sphingomonas sp. AR_OL41 TaxID=3042729 RepID=UPI0024813F4B|nr:hypothetical protein [Sphingomonas sp. AR_OL41]MDH7972890.1 hypothetical protein [Sphingomonas sp. AR_OL41]
MGELSEEQGALADRVQAAIIAAFDAAEIDFVGTDFASYAAIVAGMSRALAATSLGYGNYEEPAARLRSADFVRDAYLANLTEMQAQIGPPFGITRDP